MTVHLNQNLKVFKDQETQGSKSQILQVPYFEIRINNSGVEIPTAEHFRIFDPFYQIPSKKAPDKLSIFDSSYQIDQNESLLNSGTGLGLALVKKLVEYLQGKIEVSSAYGLTTFTIQLPVTFSQL